MCEYCVLVIQEMLRYHPLPPTRVGSTRYVNLMLFFQTTDRRSLQCSFLFFLVIFFHGSRAFCLVLGSSRSRQGPKFLWDKCSRSRPICPFLEFVTGFKLAKFSSFHTSQATPIIIISIILCDGGGLCEGAGLCEGDGVCEGDGR